MDSFWTGFEKRAVSYKWIHKHLEGGLKSRLKNLGANEDQIRKRIGMFKDVNAANTAAASKAHGMPLGDFMKSHWRGTTPDTKGTFKELAEARKSLPKKGDKGFEAASSGFKSQNEGVSDRTKGLIGGTLGLGAAVGGAVGGASLYHKNEKRAG